MGIQKKIATMIAERGADYILALKGNQGSVFEDMPWLFEQAQVVQFQDVVQDVDQTINEGHGRIEIAAVGHWQKQNSII
jgi:predicted transposase YbfD/YdcC